jgi:hypothetical protein
MMGGPKLPGQTIYEISKKKATQQPKADSEKADKAGKRSGGTSSSSASGSQAFTDKLFLLKIQEKSLSMAEKCVATLARKASFTYGVRFVRPTQERSPTLSHLFFIFTRLCFNV